MASTTAVGTSSTAQAASTFITSTITSSTSTRTSTTSTDTSASSSASATSKSSSPWDNLNLLLIFVPLVLIFLILGVAYYGGRLFPKLRYSSWRWKKVFRDRWNWFVDLCYSLVNLLFYRTTIKSTGSDQEPTKPPKERSRSASRAWIRTTQGIKIIAVNAKSITSNATARLRSIPLPSWPSSSAKKPKRPVITHHFDLTPTPEKHNTPEPTPLPEDPFPDTSTVASLSIVEEPGVLRTPDACHFTP